ncbi:MAG: protein-L-isoaspartate(D-aspartate) O-methyltransferase [Bacteroidota bacterium]
MFHRSSKRKFSHRRKQLVDLLKERGIEDPRVLDAIGTLPRHQFVDTAFESRAYEDSALPIGKGQTISQPYTVARQTELLQVQPGDKVLEIGTGSGYQAAVLCHMGADLYTVERHDELYQVARKRLQDLGYRPRMKAGDGSLGWKAYAPYDGIVVTAGAPVIPSELVRQLRVGGRMIIPVGVQESQTMTRIVRISEEEFREEPMDDFKFVPLIGKRGWPETPD